MPEEYVSLHNIFCECERCEEARLKRALELALEREAELLKGKTT